VGFLLSAVKAERGEAMSESSGASGDGSEQLPGIVVMKFGGTSVEDSHAIRRLVRTVRTRLNFGVVVVVSALAKVTDQLLRLGRSAEESDGTEVESGLNELQRRHRQLAEELLSADDDANLQNSVATEFEAIHVLLREISSSRYLSPRIQDQLLGYGECLSSKIVTEALRHQGVPAVLVNSHCCIVTDSFHTQASPLWEETNQHLHRSLDPLLQQRCVPVMGGFVGATRGGVPTTLGRGGSDLTATIVGAALHARRVEIWTDVDGVMTADPNLCPDARLIRRMSFEEAAELAQFGAKVLHPATLVPAAKANVPVNVLNSRNPEAEGTEIVAHCNSGNLVRAVTAKRSVAAVEVNSTVSADSELLHDIYSAFDRHRCPVDVMSWSHGRVSLLVSSTAPLPGIAADLQGKASVRWENHKALVCLVGENIRHQPEIASQVFAAVSDMDVRVVCHGGSDRTLSFLVDESRAEESVQRLHRLFFPSRKPPGAAFQSQPLCQAGEAWQ
jgi:aspartate kinase